MGANLDAVRAAIQQAKIVAAEFHTAEVRFYEPGNVTPVLVTKGRVKKPKPASFDAGNQTIWDTKRETHIKIPQAGTAGLVRKGMIVQVSTTDGDATLNGINFTVLSALDSQFSAERNISVATDVSQTARII